jgi:N-acyl-D-aspartate/D-glutamate deacylase
MRGNGLDVKPQVAPRPIGVLLGLEATANPFLFTRAFDEIARLPLAERVVALRDPERRRRILEEHAAMIAALPDGLFKQISGGFDVMFELADPVDYELDADWSFGARARAAGVDPAPLVYDALLERDGAAALHPAVQLRPRQLRRHLRDDLHPVLALRSLGRRRALWRDLRREHDDVVARGVGP